jgi:hypothetical protein
MSSYAFDTIEPLPESGASIPLAGNNICGPGAIHKRGGWIALETTTVPMRIDDKHVMQTHLSLTILCVFVFGLALYTRIYPYGLGKASIKTFTDSAIGNEEQSSQFRPAINNGIVVADALLSPVPVVFDCGETNFIPGDSPPGPQSFAGLVRFQRPPPYQWSWRRLLCPVEATRRMRCAI